MRENNFSEDSKPWYQSTTIISAVATGLVALAGAFKVQIGDLQPQILEGLTALGVTIGTIVTVYGRVRAHKTIQPQNPPDDSDGMSGRYPSSLIAILLIPMFALTSCTTTGDSGSGSSVSSSISKALPFIRPSVALTCSTVLNLAISESDRVDKANYVYGVAKAVRSLSTGVAPTVDDVKNVISLWAPDKTHWANLAVSIGSIYGGIYPLIQGDAQLAFQVLEAIALGCEDAAGTIIGAN